jgi:hypothetical protein
MESLAERVSAIWARLGKIATAVIAVVAAFLAPPPYDEYQNWTAFAKFLVVIVTGLMLVKMRSNDMPADVPLWRRWTIGSVLVGVLLLVCYTLSRSAWTASYAGSNVPIGRDYTRSARTYIAHVEHSEHVTLQPADIIARSGGPDHDIWPKSQIEQDAIVIAFLYIATMCAFAVTVLSLVQFLQCAGVFRGKASQSRDAAGSVRRL